MSGRRPHTTRALLLALVAGGAVACGSILGIGDPSLRSEGGVAEGGGDGTGGGMDVTVQDASDASDATVDASEAGEDSAPDTTAETASEDGGIDADAAEAEACPAGQIVCPAGCIDPTSDPNNCSACGTTCPNGQSCVNSVCQCPAGKSACPGTDGGGGGDASTVGSLPYCADLTSDPSNCSTCGKSCPVANDTPACVAGACTVGTCAAGYADCNGNPSDGCEVYTKTDNAHCGACGNSCTGGSLCSNGTCVFTCGPGQTVCHTGSADGGTPYCATLATDSQNCGGCGTDCSTQCVGNVASFSCTARVCGVGSCAQGHYNLDGVCANGCECQASAVGSCATPLSLGMLSVGGQVTAAGNLVPGGTDTYYQVTFTGNTSPTYHPHVVFAGNPNGEFVFDILTDCMGTSASCVDVDGGQAVGLTEWEVQYASGVMFATGFVPIPAIGTALIHVYRAPGAPVDCGQYSLVIDN